MTPSQEIPDRQPANPKVTARRRPAGACPPTVGVVIPFHRRVELLNRCLEAVARLAPPPDDVVVVCDGDAAGVESAGRCGVRILEHPQRLGPAASRNHGAVSTDSEVVLFIDADVVVPADTVARIRRSFAADRTLAAVFGSYDDRPPAPGLVSHYKNLLHHWTHQHARSDASTFWTGCGAIRRSVFLELGGFDPDQRWLEDVELGYRLRAAGCRVVLDPTLQVSHLKKWTLTGVVVSDIFHRALPWTELANRYRSLPRDLNTDLRGRVAAGVSAAAVLSAAAGARWTPMLALTAFFVAFLVALNAGLYRLFFRRGGAALLIVGMLLHWTYLLYGAAAFAIGSVWYRAAGGHRSTRRSPLPDRGVRRDGDGVESEGASPRAARRSA